MTEKLFKSFFSANVGNEAEMRFKDVDGEGFTKGKITPDSDNTMYQIGDIWVDYQWFESMMINSHTKVITANRIYLVSYSDYYDFKINNN